MDRDPKMTLIIGPCVIESEGLVQEIAQELKRQLKGLPVDAYFKASFDKANRTSIEGFRGPGMKDGLRILDRVRELHGFRLLTDIHLPDQAAPAAEVVDYLQVPAFLCRQTDLVQAGAEAALRRGKRLNVKKGQFLAPWDVGNIIEKARVVARRLSVEPAPDWLSITERGSSFGYNALVVDMGAFQSIQAFGVPVIYDATHSVQVPGAGPAGKSTGGRREILESLARAAMAAGADGLFMEVHPRPSEALSDGANAFPLEQAGAFVRQLLELRRLTRSLPRLLEKT
jgi:2-dehydro-3-deoxyphosphooctonate aldolase (KDO 8-P synthase)